VLSARQTYRYVGPRSWSGGLCIPRYSGIQLSCNKCSAFPWTYLRNYGYFSERVHEPPETEDSKELQDLLKHSKFGPRYLLDRNVTHALTLHFVKLCFAGNSMPVSGPSHFHCCSSLWMCSTAFKSLSKVCPFCWV
jgi:hypothetical protein